MRSLRIGLLLGLRQIQRASRWTTALIILVMMLTFVNLVAVSGILVGLPVGAERAVQERTIGDLQIRERDGEDHILATETIVQTLAHDPRVAAYSVRYDATGLIEANYQTRRDLSADRDAVTAPVIGIDPSAEDQVSGIAETLTEGTYFTAPSNGQILIGSLLIERYAEDFPDVVHSLRDIEIGEPVRITIGSVTEEFTVQGVIDSKVGELNNSVFINERELRRLSGRIDRNADRISIRMADGATAVDLQRALHDLGFDQYAQIRTAAEAMPRFVIDIRDTFNILGVVIGAVGIVVASITIFIIIFINAVSRRRQIGILKGIGINQRAIEIAYIIQAAIYVVLGSLLGVLLVYGFLVGYFDRNPIDFPFSDGILVVDPTGTLLRFAALFVVTLIAGFIPAWLICRQNTLDAILGRT